MHKEGVRGADRANAKRVQLEEAKEQGLLNDELSEQLAYELELLSEAGNSFTKEAFLAGEITPVFFGSALTNFGVEPFFDTFSELAPPPRPRDAFDSKGEECSIDPVEHPFSAFVFKIQANMDPRHRDSMAYLRVCSGEFERDLSIKHHRLGKEIRLSRSHSMFGGERNIVEAAYPGDVIGVVNPGIFAIGDTISTKGGFTFRAMPKFPPEVVARIRPKDVSKRKSFDKGMRQLSDEGAVLVLEGKGLSGDSLVAAVGRLQFDVLQYRLEQEYKAKTVLETLPYQHGAWLKGDPETFKLPSSSMLAKDLGGRHIMLFVREWEKQYAAEQNPEHELLDFIDH